MLHVHVYWTRRELEVVLATAEDSSLFPGRSEVLRATRTALGVTSSGRALPNAKKGKRPGRVLLQLDSAEELIARLTAEKAARDAATRLERAIHRARLRGKARGTNRAAAGRKRRVARGDAPHLKP
jgi:hypothetical protein